MKRCLFALFLLFVVGVLTGLTIDVTPLADISDLNPMQSLVYFDVNGDGIDEWFIISESYDDGMDTVKIAGFDTSGQQAFYTELIFPRTVADADHDEPKFTIYRSGDDARLLLVQGNRYWDTQSMVISMRFYDFPSMAFLNDYSHSIDISEVSTPYTRRSFETIRRPYLVNYNGEPHIYLTMMHRVTAVDEYSSAAATNSFIYRYALNELTPAYSDSLGTGGNNIFCPDNITGCMLSMDATTDMHEMEGHYTYDVTYSLIKLATSDAHADSVLYYVEGGRVDYTLNNFPAAACIVTQCDTTCSVQSPSLGLFTQISNGGVASPSRSLEYLTVSPDNIELWEQPDIDVEYCFSAASYVSIPDAESYILALCYRYGYNVTELAIFDRTDGSLLETTTGDYRVPIELFEADGQYYLVSKSVSGDIVSLYRIESILLKANDETTAQTSRLSAYPNPFNPETTVAFNMSVAGHTRLDVYDIRGRRVCTLADEPFEAGEHTIRWSAQNLPSGVYLLHLSSPDGNQTSKVVLLK